MKFFEAELQYGCPQAELGNKYETIPIKHLQNLKNVKSIKRLPDLLAPPE
jgi:hypothetical protein